MRFLRFISRIFIGIVFIYSGFVKGIDPLGSTYKFIDYFEAFGLGFLDSFALPLAIFLSTAEFVIGISMFFGVRMKHATLATVLFMAVFTPLTFYLAIANPVTDCGCFGDALILTNWQTFWKNIVILIPTIFAFYQRKNFIKKYNFLAEWSVVVIFVMIMTSTSIFSYKHLPIIDYRPYKTGTYISEGMIVPEGAPIDEYETTFIYEKDATEKEFSLSNLPDSTWSWKDTKNELIKEGYHPPIHDFDIQSIYGEVITDIVLADEGYAFLLISYDLTESDISSQQKINELSDYCLANNHNFICLTSSTSEIDDFVDNTGANYQFYNTDEITLKTIIRSNPGLVLLKSGVILGKFHYNDIPEVEEFNDNFLSYFLKKYRQKNENLFRISLGLSLFLVLSLFVLINFFKVRK